MSRGAPVSVRAVSVLVPMTWSFVRVLVGSPGLCTAGQHEESQAGTVADPARGTTKVVIEMGLDLIYVLILMVVLLAGHLRLQRFSCSPGPNL